MSSRFRNSINEYQLYMVKDYLKIKTLPHWVGVDLSNLRISRRNNHLPTFFILNSVKNFNTMTVKESKFENNSSSNVWGSLPHMLFGVNKQGNKRSEKNVV